MDHLDFPHDCIPLGLRVPWFDASQYDMRGSFHEQATTNGFLLDEHGLLSFEELTMHDSTEAMGFIQAWLYFGTLQIALGDQYSLQDFVNSDESGDFFVNTASLVTTHYGLLKEPRIVYARVALVMLQLYELDKDWAIASKEWALLMLSAWLLLAFINPPSHHLSDDQKLERARIFELGQLSRPHRASRSLLCSILLQRPGWCPHQVKQLSDDYGVETLLYLACLKRHPKEGTSHALCHHTERCVGLNVDNETFRSAHLRVHCDCSQVKANIRDMHAIIRNGGIPFIQCYVDEQCNPTLSYRRATPFTRYTALSHLWADGLGNPSGNSLPLCQLQKLLFKLQYCDRFTLQLMLANKASGGKTTLRNGLSAWLFNRIGQRANFSNRAPPLATVEDWRSLLQPNSYINFWLDVYSIPVALKGDPDEHKAEMNRLKGLAISRMTLTYAMAQSVLTVDSELEHITKDMDETEVLARMAVCGWNTRCWTFQEAILGKVNVYYGGDGPSAVAPWDKAFDSGLTPMRRSPQRRLEIVRGDLLTRVKAPSSIYTGDGYTAGWIFGPDRSIEHGLSVNTSLRPELKSPMKEYIKNARQIAAMNIGQAYVEEAKQVAWCWNGLRMRNTTKAEDMIVILANLLGVNGEHLMALKAEREDERWQEIKELRRLPGIDQREALQQEEALDQTEADEVALRAEKARLENALQQEKARQRMKAILKARYIIPAEILFCHGLQRDSHIGSAWIPSTVSSSAAITPFESSSSYGFAELRDLAVVLHPGILKDEADGERAWCLVRLDRNDISDSARQIAASPRGTAAVSRYWFELTQQGLDRIRESNHTDVYFVLGNHKITTAGAVRYGICLTDPVIKDNHLIANYACSMVWDKYIPGAYSESQNSEPLQAPLQPEQIQVGIRSDIHAWPTCDTSQDILGRGNNRLEVVKFVCNWVFIVGAVAIAVVILACAIQFEIWGLFGLLLVLIPWIPVSLAICYLTVDTIMYATDALDMLKYERPELEQDMKAKNTSWWRILDEAWPDPNSRPHNGARGISLSTLGIVISVIKLIHGELGRKGRNRNTTRTASGNDV